MVKEGTRWVSNEGNIFHVVHRIELDGKTWIHYEQDNCKECREFSCYEESFMLRFRQLPE
jgi:hypothetical protein